MLNMHGFQITVANVYQPGKKHKKWKVKAQLCILTQFIKFYISLVYNVY